jgi:hypothetical protein
MFETNLLLTTHLTNTLFDCEKIGAFTPIVNVSVVAPVTSSFVSVGVLLFVSVIGCQPLL